MAESTNASTRLEANKKLVLEFYDAMIGRKDFEAGRKYMGETYTQHAPYATDGHEGLRAFVEWFRTSFPGHRYEIKRVIAEGDFVMLHVHGTIISCLSIRVISSRGARIVPPGKPDFCVTSRAAYSGTPVQPYQDIVST